MLVKGARMAFLTCLIMSFSVYQYTAGHCKPALLKVVLQCHSISTLPCQTKEARSTGLAERVVVSGLAMAMLL